MAMTATESAPMRAIPIQTSTRRINFIKEDSRWEEMFCPILKQFSVLSSQFSGGRFEAALESAEKVLVCEDVYQGTSLLVP